MQEQQFQSQLPPAEPMVPQSALQRSDAKAALQTFLTNIERMQHEKRMAYFGPGRQYDMPASIVQPQVFFSYAWGQANDPRFVQLQNFLMEMSAYLRSAGVRVWFDLERMVGDVESQMRDGVTKSDLVLLFGTDVYAQKTGVDSRTNVKKELDFTLSKAARDKHCLMPLLLEGSFQTTFPSLGFKYIMADLTAWIDLNHGHHDMQAYVKTLTSLNNPVGILPAVLGLQRLDDEYQAYRDSCRQSYADYEKILTTELAKIYSARSVQPAAQILHPEEKRDVNAVPVAGQQVEKNTLQQTLVELNQKRTDLFASTATKKISAVQTLEELSARIKKLEAQYQAAEGEDWAPSIQVDLVKCQTIYANVKALDDEIGLVQEKLAALAGGPIPSKLNVSASKAAIFGSKGAAIARIKAAPKVGVQVDLNVDEARIEDSDGAVIGGIEFS